jgi:hypothetical protein
MHCRTTGSSETLGEYLRRTAILAVGDPSPVGQNKDWGSLLSVTGETFLPSYEAPARPARAVCRRTTRLVTDCARTSK